MEGYMENAQGHQVPLDQVKEIDRVRHELVLEKVVLFKALRLELRDLKADTMGDIEAFVQLSAEKYGAKVGGDKGNVTLWSYDGKYKLQRQISEHLMFGEQLKAAKALIDECIKEWTKDSRSELKALIDDAFQVDKEGRINTGRILGLRRLKIEDERWKMAMEAISDSLQVVGSKAYVRLYERQTDGSYAAISLDMATV
ncbi:MAG: DUF3164 family protein [Proteobacteria bacterium]|nr:DUF3164 family protein [Pseudomonadota bacterium]